MYPGIDPRQMQAMMRKLGISSERIDASEVIIRTPGRTLVIRSPDVVMMQVQGQEMYQVSGRAETLTGDVEVDSAATGSVDASFSDEDVEIVMSQTGASRERAVEALRACGGAPAEAIVHILSRKG